MFPALLVFLVQLLFLALGELVTNFLINGSAPLSSNDSDHFGVLGEPYIIKCDLFADESEVMLLGLSVDFIRGGVKHYCSAFRFICGEPPSVDNCTCTQMAGLNGSFEYHIGALRKKDLGYWFCNVSINTYKKMLKTDYYLLELEPKPPHKFEDKQLLTKLGISFLVSLTCLLCVWQWWRSGRRRRD